MKPNDPWTAVAVTYGDGVEATAKRLERWLNRLHDEGYVVRYIFHADPHFVAVAERTKRKGPRVPEVRQSAGTG